MNKVFYTPNEERFFDVNDSRTIQNAIRQAMADGVNCVMIPRMNARTGKDIWDIPETLLLPSGITLILDQCHMRMADFTYCHMITNEHCYREGQTAENEDHDITVTGVGNAVLEGGVHNELLEKHNRVDGLPAIIKNSLMLFHNARNVTVENLHLKWLRWWGITFSFCHHSRVSHINYYARELVPNLDGVDLRPGCHDFVIENITGTTADDVVALTALNFGDPMLVSVEGKDSDIHDVRIRNIKGDACRWCTVRLLTQNGNKEYNITVENVMDTSRTEFKKAPRAAVLIGENIYHKTKLHEMGDMDNITVRNVYSRANTAVELNGKISNLNISNVHVFGDGRQGIATRTDEDGGVELKNCVIDGFFHGVEQKSMFLIGKGEYDCSKYRHTALDFGRFSGALTCRNVFVDKIKTGVKATGGIKATLENAVFHQVGGYTAVRDPKSQLTVNGEDGEILEFVPFV